MDSSSDVGASTAVLKLAASHKGGKQPRLCVRASGFRMAVGMAIPGQRLHSYDRPRHQTRTEAPKLGDCRTVSTLKSPLHMGKAAAPAKGISRFYPNGLDSLRIRFGIEINWKQAPNTLFDIFGHVYITAEGRRAPEASRSNDAPGGPHSFNSCTAPRRKP